MTNIGRAGAREPLQGIEALSNVEGGDAPADAETGSGAPAAARTARPRSLDLGALGLERALAAKLGEGKGVEAGPAVAAPKAANADAEAVKKLLRGTPNALADGVLARFKALVHNVGLGDNAPPPPAAEVARFKSFLGALEKEGKLDELYGMMKKADGSKLKFGDGGLTPDAPGFYLGVLIGENATSAQKKAAGW